MLSTGELYSAIMTDTVTSVFEVILIRLRKPYVSEKLVDVMWTFSHS